jgi:hypothetical protein
MLLVNVLVIRYDIESVNETHPPRFKRSNVVYPRALDMVKDANNQSQHDFEMGLNEIGWKLGLSSTF